MLLYYLLCRTLHLNYSFLWSILDLCWKVQAKDFHIKGYTDYNFNPAGYWINIRQLDLLCQKNEIVNRKVEEKR